MISLPCGTHRPRPQVSAEHPPRQKANKKQCGTLEDRRIPRMHMLGRNVSNGSVLPEAGRQLLSGRYASHELKASVPGCLPSSVQTVLVIVSAANHVVRRYISSAQVDLRSRKSLVCDPMRLTSEAPRQASSPSRPGSFRLAYQVARSRATLSTTVLSMSH